MSFANPPDEDRRALLTRVKIIAVVGLSPKPGRPSYFVARAMQSLGYRIVPVRPAITSALGETAYARLADIPFPVDLVNVFRASEHVPEVVEETLAIGAPALWLQEGVVHEPAALRARDAGVVVVMDRCIYKDHASLM